ADREAPGGRETTPGTDHFAGRQEGRPSRRTRRSPEKTPRGARRTHRTAAAAAGAPTAALARREPGGGGQRAVADVVGQVRTAALAAEPAVFPGARGRAPGPAGGAAGVPPRRPDAGAVA